MARTIGIGHQDFGELILNNCFYVDKTSFIKEWWESGDVVTLITRPRRFGKTLTMSMLEYFFSIKYADMGNLFEGLAIWQDKSSDGDKTSGEGKFSGENYKYRQLQGTYPVISLSFASVKETDYRHAREKICQLIGKLVREGSPDIKITMEDLLQGEVFHTEIDEQIVFDQLDYRQNAIWSLFLASGYLKVESYDIDSQ